MGPPAPTGTASLAKGLNWLQTGTERPACGSKLALKVALGVVFFLTNVVVAFMLVRRSNSPQMWLKATTISYFVANTISATKKKHEKPHLAFLGCHLTLVGSGASKLKPTGTGSEMLRSKLALAATECSSSRSELALPVRQMV